MKLTYRGTSYESDIPNIDVTEGEIGGKYRGQNWKYNYPRHIPISGPPQHLKYRGVAFTKPEINTAPALAIDSMTEKIGRRQPKFAESPTTKKNIGPIHQAKLCRILDRRKQAARLQGDRQLLEQLENESQYLVCS